MDGWTDMMKLAVAFHNKHCV